MAKTAKTAVVTTQDRARILSSAVAEVARHLGISSVELGGILGISQSSASRLMNGIYSLHEHQKEWELAALFVRLYRGLYSIVGSNDQLAMDWLKSRNSAFGNQVPLAVIQQASGLVHACDYVDAHRAPA
ncbi:MAG: DUF2384 domain-containing protein [Betaproteobacteria bacterium]|jgi:hypothetical protein|nr:DUF2384 domain-containing protein [Betaproteobacteria bacterium]